ncbi:hypothetical protein ACFPVS_09755 [Neisseria weixii]|uniref:hypothetical protein n=1 Tax=Neisseria weixii TaxID=1853276 RepID=UPI000BB884B0|nr:hypothetical protein [Neisseria weixii]ATD64920.1 hypothetical protein CGZ65_05570 [Neisseria weixii]
METYYCVIEGIIAESKNPCFISKSYSEAYNFTQVWMQKRSAQLVEMDADYQFQKDENIDFWAVGNHAKGMDFIWIVKFENGLPKYE